MDIQRKQRLRESALLRERCEREDLVMFINTCFAATEQNEFYIDRYEQSVSIAFLHEYVLVNYRRLYARVLAAGINHFNQATIILNLLRAGAPTDAHHRKEEGQLILAALLRLPANRAYSVLQRTQQQRINNRRTRAIVKAFLQSRRDPEFDAIKYRSKYRAAVTHAHAHIPDEFYRVLFDLKRQRKLNTPLFETFRKAHFAREAIYGLPFTVAESLAQKHNVPRDEFFRKIEPKMTAAEKLRYQQTIQRTKGVDVGFDLARAPLTKLALYLLSLPIAERRERATEFEQSLREAAKRSLHRRPLELGHVVAILDRSRSTWGSRQKRRRPLGVALGISYLLAAASERYQAIWTPNANVDPAANESRVHVNESSTQPEYLIEADGQTRLADALLDALELKPDLIVIVSDGFENDPPLGVSEVLRVYRERLRHGKDTEIVHVNPVFDAEHYSPRTICDGLTTVGIRDAEDLPTMLGFARFANGTAPLKYLEQYLAARVRFMLRLDD